MELVLFNLTPADYGLQERALLGSWGLVGLLHLLQPGLHIVVRHLYISCALHRRWVPDLFGLAFDGIL